MVLKRNTFSSHCDSTYPDVLFMRWGGRDEKEKHTNVNGYISIQRKPWNKTRASFQAWGSSGMRKTWHLLQFHHGADTHCVHEHGQAEGSCKSRTFLDYEELETCMTTFSQPLVHPRRKPGILANNILHLELPLYRKSNWTNGAQRLMRHPPSFLPELRSTHSRPPGATGAEYCVRDGDPYGNFLLPPKMANLPFLLPGFKDPALVFTPQCNQLKAPSLIASNCGHLCCSNTYPCSLPQMGPHKPVRLILSPQMRNRREIANPI